VGHFGPIIEAVKDQALGQYLQNVVRRHQSSLLGLKLPDFYKNHEIRGILLNPSLIFSLDIAKIVNF
jgi:hypothetical protein